ncbi:MAG: hypothetical protein AB1724_19810 [Thermodesulfobacteriota bacterium]
MSAYLSRLTDSPGFGRINGLKPDSLCPYLYYTIAPYIYTIANGGWFSWVKRARNPETRSPAIITNYRLKKNNGRFVNEVVVRCPNPRVPVIAGIGPWTGGAVSVRILHGGGDCLYRHSPGQQVFLDSENGRQPLAYSRQFPEVLLRSLTDLPLKTAMTLFDQGHAGSITPAEIISPCRFHHGKTPHDSRRLLPDNCCPHVFQHVYPDVLAAMVDAGSDPLLAIQHPGRNDGENGGKMTVEIKKMQGRRNRTAGRLVDGLYALSRFLGHPRERLDYRLEIRVAASKAAGECPMKIGAVCAVNLNNSDFLCPASFHAAYPYLLLAAAGEKMAWDGSRGDNRIPCPDCAGVIYMVKN